MTSMGTTVGFSFIGACALAFVGIAHTRAMKMKEQSRKAAEYSWYAMALLSVCLATLFLSWNGDLPMVAQRILLGIFGAIFGATALIALGEILHPMELTAQPASPQATDNLNTPKTINITGGDNVVSIGQIGGVTARSVTINPPLRPELRILERTELIGSDGAHIVTLKAEVASPITPGLLTIQIESEGIRHVTIAPPPINGVSSLQMRNVRKSANRFYAEIPSPRGIYEISITNSGAAVNLNASF
jgi:hypothetical protein